MAVPDVSGRSLDGLMDLRGRVAVVTGGGRGIGLAIAKRLAEAGAAVVIGDVDSDMAQQAAESLKQPGRSLGLEADVTSEASVAALAGRAEDELGPISIWVNNAGVFPRTPVLDMSMEDWDLVLGVNLRGTFIGAREAARRMTMRPTVGMSIVNIGSVAAYRAAGVGLGHYVASKHAVLGLTKSLAVELGPAGIRVLGIAPIRTDTPGMKREMDNAPSDAVVNKALDLPLGRTAVPDDIARVALFCASDLSMMMTGTTILVDGGAMAQ